MAGSAHFAYFDLYPWPFVKTGGLADTVKNLSNNGIDGSGFVFEEFNADGILFGIRGAMGFYQKDEEFKYRVLARIMKESVKKYNIKETAKQYIELYEEIFKLTGQKVSVI